MDGPLVRRKGWILRGAALNVTAYYTAAAGAFVLPDGPFLFFALLTLWALSEALVGSPGSLMPWIWVGLAWGGALLSKYHASFLPAGALLYVFLTPSARRCLLSPGPYIAVAIGGIAFAPVLIWNAENDWASFAFQANRAVGMHFRPASVLITVGGQALYLFPWIWLALIIVLIGQVRAGMRAAGLERLASCLARAASVFSGRVLRADESATLVPYRVHSVVSSLGPALERVDGRRTVAHAAAG